MSNDSFRKSKKESPKAARESRIVKDKGKSKKRSEKEDELEKKMERYFSPLLRHSDQFSGFGEIMKSAKNGRNLLKKKNENTARNEDKTSNYSNS